MQRHCFTGWLFYKEYFELIRKEGYKANITEHYLQVLVCTIFLHILFSIRINCRHALPEGLSQPVIRETKNLKN